MVNKGKIDGMDKKIDLLDSIVGQLIHALYETRSISREQAADLFHKLGVEMPEQDALKEPGDA